MSVLFRCPVCNRRHFGKCPIMPLWMAYADIVKAMAEALKERAP